MGLRTTQKQKRWYRVGEVLVEVLKGRADVLITAPREQQISTGEMPTARYQELTRPISPRGRRGRK